jgi:hypothetical protein
MRFLGSLAVAEGIIQWVTLNFAQFASRSIPSFGSSLAEPPSPPMRGLLLPRELDERLGLGALIEGHPSDPRTGSNFQFSLGRSVSSIDL